MKEKWICSEKDPVKQKEKAEKWEPDLVREKEVKGVIKKGPEIRMMGGKNLFLDMNVLPGNPTPSKMNQKSQNSGVRLA